MKKKSLVGFGKYKNLTFDQVLEEDPEYFIKMRDCKFFKEYAVKETRDYNKIYNKYIASKKKLLTSSQTAPITEAMMDRGIELMFEWVSKSEFDRIITEEHNPNKKQLSELYTKCKSIYQRHCDEEKINIISLHLSRYEVMFKELDKLKYDHIKKWEWRLKLETKKLSDMLNVMYSKEKLLGIHNKTFKIRLNNFFEKRKASTTPDVNFDLLKQEERIELLNLFDKCKKVDQAPISIQGKRDENLIEEIAFEELPLIENTLKNAEVEVIDNESDKEKPLTLEDLKKILKQK